MSRRGHLLLRALLFACLLGLALPAAVAPADAVPHQATVVTAQPKPNPHRAVRAQKVLDNVTDLLNGLTSPTKAHRDLSLQLRDLLQLEDALSPADRARADRLLARPTANPNRCPDVRCYQGDDRQICNDTICVHWVPASEDPKNAPVSMRYVHQVLKTVTRIDQKYVAAGYRKPMSDGGRGGNNKPDIYLAQIGDQGLYGYCAPEGPRSVSHGSMWGYCVLDNNYSHQEFPAHSPLQNMKVTAAHEFFHDVQFAMDAGEDAWFMEATATWAEDMVFDKINDNAFYLPYGPLANPQIPINTFNGLFQYGDWIFFRYLTDRYDTKTAGMNDLVLKMWKAAAGKKAGHNSLRAIKLSLGKDGTDLPDELARFSAGSRRPQETYHAEVAEVARQGIQYPKAPLQAKKRVGATPVVLSASYKHLTAKTYRFTAASAGNLTFDISFGTAAGAGRAVIVTKVAGSPVTKHLVTTGGPQTPIAYDPSTTKWVEVTIVNGKTSGHDTESVTATLTP
jgi:hypothetical protein